MASALQERNLLDKVGGIAYLSSLMDTVQTAASAGYYAKIIREKAQLRRLIHAGTEIAGLGFEGESDPNAALEDAETRLAAVTDAGVAKASSEWMQRGIVRIMQTIGAELDAKLQPTPFPKLNLLLGGGFTPSTVNAWVAAPKMGKSALIAEIAMHVAETQGPVAFFALELGERPTEKRMLSLRSGISQFDMRDPNLSDDKRNILADAAQEIYDLPIKFFGGVPQLSVADIRREARKMKREAGDLKAIVIDHINFTKDATSFGSKMSKHERLDEAYMKLIAVAKELEVVVHIVQHTNRQGMQGPPTLSTIRDGGNIEGHAHTVLFPYRPDYINEPTIGELIVAANREGEHGIIPMNYLGACYTWLQADQAAPWFRASENPWT
jgi:replicative DNA helicase